MVGREDVEIDFQNKLTELANVKLQLKIQLQNGQPYSGIVRVFGKPFNGYDSLMINHFAKTLEGVSANL